MKPEKRFYILLWIFPWATLFWEPLATLVLALMLVNNYTMKGAFQSLKLIAHWPVAIAFFAVYAYLLLSGFWSDDLGEFSIKAQIKASFFFLPLAFFPMIKKWKTKATKRFMDNVHNAVVGAALFCYLEALYQIITTGDWARYWPDGGVHDYHLFYTGLAEPLGHPAYLSMYAGLAILIAFRRARNEINRRNYWTLWLIFDVIFLLFLQGKMNLLAFGIAAGIALLVLAIRTKSYVKLGLLFAVPTALVVGLVLVKPAALEERFKEPLRVDYDITSNDFNDFTSLTIRLAEWECATDAINKNPILGAGGGDARSTLFQAYEDHHFTLGIERQFNCHNQYIENTLAGGWVGLFLLLALFVIGVMTGIHRNNGTLITFIAYFALAILTESMFERFQGVALFTLILTVYTLPAYHRENFVKVHPKETP